MEEGRNMLQVGVSLKKIQPLSITGVLRVGGTGIRRPKAVWEGQDHKGWSEKKGPGGGGLFGNWVKGLPSLCWDLPSPYGLAEEGQPATPDRQS